MAYQLAWLICTWKVLGTLPSLHFYFFTFYFFIFIIYYLFYYFLLTIIFYYFTWNGPKMFVDLDWPTHASSPLSASAELLVYVFYVFFKIQKQHDLLRFLSWCTLFPQQWLRAVWRHVTKGREGVNFSLKMCDVIYGWPLYAGLFIENWKLDAINVSFMWR